MAHIDYYFTTLSPFAYLADQRLERIAEAEGASITYKTLAIMALFSRTGGQAPKDRHPSRMAYRNQEVRRQAKKTGMKMSFQPTHWPINAAPSSYAIIAAQAAGGGDMGALVHGVLRACWAEDRDIAEDAVIRDCLEQAGFDPALADSGLLSGAETYAANLEEAVSVGVFGSPFYVVDSGEMFWGQDRLDDLQAHLQGKL